MRIVMSSGHGKYVRGASGPKPWGLDEVDEARRVVNQAATAMRGMGVDITTFHDDISRTQSENLNRIVSFHNSKTRDLDISVHFNSTNPQPSGPVGCEVLYKTKNGLTHAKPTVDAICAASGLINRGPKLRNNLAFLNNTEEPAILIEVCFVNSHPDVDIYNAKFIPICNAIAEAVSGQSPGPSPEPPPDIEALLDVTGKCSTFGGPEDDGVSPTEGLGFISSIDQAPHLFLPYQPEGTTGLARRLNPYVHYIACRWDYNVTPHAMLRSEVAMVHAIKTGIEMKAFPGDWGPHVDTGRVADLSPQLMEDLGITTDDEVHVIFPYKDE